MSPGEILQSLPAHQREDALWLLCALLNKSKSEIYLDSRAELSSACVARWRRWWARRQMGEPLQYVAGSAPFYGREFLVDRNVLIPRPETERLVELALGLMESKPGGRVLDIGTGSGCIAITLKLERPELRVTASDISGKALAVARKNGEALAAEVNFERHDLFSPKLQRAGWDLVISNPPYLDFAKDRIAEDVREWEPRMALEPLSKQKTRSTRDRASWCAERILQSCELVRPAYTALELSPRVAAALERRWRKAPGVARVWREADLAGRKRFLLVAWKERPVSVEE